VCLSVPLHVSARSHSPAAARHTRAVGTLRRYGIGRTVRPGAERSLVRSSCRLARVRRRGQDYAGGGKAVCRARGRWCRCRSRPRRHAPATARHTVPALPAGCWQRALLPLQVVSCARVAIVPYTPFPLVSWHPTGRPGSHRPVPRLRPGRHVAPRLRGTPCRWGATTSAGQLWPRPVARSRPDRTGRPTRRGIRRLLGLQAVGGQVARWSPCRFPQHHRTPVAARHTRPPHCRAHAGRDCCYHCRCRSCTGCHRRYTPCRSSTERAIGPRAAGAGGCRVDAHRRRTAPEPSITRRAHTSRR